MRKAAHREGPMLQRSEVEVTVKNSYFSFRVGQQRKPRPMKVRGSLRVTLLEPD